jgi:osmotically-inducible protein OsmY
MQRSLFLIALLLCASLVSAKQTSTASSQDGKSASTPQEKQNQSVSQAGSSNNKQEQNNPNGGSPSSPAPGRVTGETPTQVQTALDKQLPTGSDVTASVTDDGSMKLTGTVKTEADKSKAEQIASSVSGRKINNKLQVKSAQGNQDQSSNPK